MDLLVLLDITCIIQLDTAADGLAGVAQHHLVQMDALANGLAICTLTLYFYVTMSS